MERVIVYVDLEHERLRRHPQNRENLLLNPNRLEIKYRLEDVADDLCLIVRYNRLSVQLLRELSPSALS